MKYVDIELLTKEIDSLYDKWCGSSTGLEVAEEGASMSTAESIFEEIRKIINSLQREQPKPNLENEIKDYTEALYHETFGNGQGTLDEFDWEDIAMVIEETARHFYELCQLNAR